MSKPESIKIDDIEYVRKDQTNSFDGPIKIAVLDKSFVYIGIVEELSNGSICLHKAKNIRIWGTSKGLGELVNGPLPNTRLDLVGTIFVPLHAIIHIIDVDQTKWTL